MSSSRGLSMCVCVTALAVAFLATRWIVSMRPDSGDHNYSDESGKKKLMTVIKSEEEVEEYPPFEGGAVGPESLAFDGNGEGPYVGLSDGRIVKWVQHQWRWVDFAFISPNRKECGARPHEETEHICGRPLGLRFHLQTGDLYIADAYLGLLVVSSDGGLAQKVAVQEEDVALGFINGLDIDQTRGLVYFTESSTRFSRSSYFSAILTGDTTGRLLRYDIQAKRVTLLLTNLTFPNGVSLANLDGRSILLAESTNCRILRYWPPQQHEEEEEEEEASFHQTTRPAGGKLEVFAHDLLGYPDNIKKMEVAAGDQQAAYYWVGIYTRRTRLAQWALSRPWVGEAIVRGRPVWLNLITAIVRRRAVGMAIKLSEEGRVVEVLQDATGKLNFISEVDETEEGRKLMFGSVIMPSVTLYNRRAVDS